MINVTIAIDYAVAFLGIPHYSKIPASLAYVAQPDSSLILAHTFQLRNAETSKWVQSHVDATHLKPSVVHVADYVVSAAYNVVESSQQDPTWSGFKSVTNPQDPIASPNGWHQDSKENYTATQG